MSDRAGAGSDIGRRIALRREQLCLTHEQLAERAGVAAGYLRYVEEQPTADPGPGFLLRTADALGTTLARLRGGDAERPPGTGKAARHPVLSELDRDVCMSLISSHGMGRVVVATAGGTAVLPVNYDVVDGAVVFRTAPGAAPSRAVGTEVAFEVDRIDEAMSTGWSVLVTGHASRVTDPDGIRRLSGRARTAPWAGGDRPLWVRVDPVRVSGRRISAG